VLGAKSGKARLGKDAAGDALLDELLGEIEHEPLTLGSSSLKKGFGSSAATANRTALPKVRIHIHIPIYKERHLYMCICTGERAQVVHRGEREGGEPARRRGGAA